MNEEKPKLIGRGVPPERLAVRPLTYSDVQKMDTMEMEWNELENADNLRAAIELNPQERTRRKETYTDAKVTRLLSRRATPEEAKACSANIQTVFQRYPWVIDCEDNARALIKRFDERRVDTTDLAQVESAVVDAIADGMLYLNPAAVSPEFERLFGDELYGYAVSRLSADQLKKLTTPCSQSEQQKIEAMSADEYWNADPELARARYGDAYYARALADMQRQAVRLRHSSRIIRVTNRRTPTGTN